MIVHRITGRPRLSAGDPFDRVDHVRRDMFRLLDAITSAASTAPSAGMFPPMNVTQDRDRYYVRAEMPGVNGDDLDVTAANRTIAVSGSRRVQEEQGVSYHRKERAEGDFSRSVTLPGDFDHDSVQARYVNGVLTLIVAKPEQAKPRQIAVKTS